MLLFILLSILFFSNSNKEKLSTCNDINRKSSILLRERKYKKVIDTIKSNRCEFSMSKKIFSSLDTPRKGQVISSNSLLARAYFELNEKKQAIEIAESIIYSYNRILSQNDKLLLKNLENDVFEMKIIEENA